MKKNYLMLFLTVTFYTNAQEKFIKYYDNDGHEVSKNLFIQKEHINPLELKSFSHENDTLKYKILKATSIRGILSKHYFQSLKNTLINLKRDSIQVKENLLIIYIPKNYKKDVFSKWNVLKKRFVKKMTSDENLKTYFITTPSNKDLPFLHNEYIDWLIDKNDVINKIFFQDNVFQSAFIFIKPNREIDFCYGSFDKNFLLLRKHNFFDKIDYSNRIYIKHKQKKQYFDINNIEITESEFLKIQEKNNYNYSVFKETNDQIEKNKLVQVYKKGILDKNQLKRVKNYLQADSTKVSVIIYLPKKHTKPNKAVSTWNIFNKDFRTFVSRKHTRRLDAELFWITATGNKDLKYFHNWEIPWQEDTSDLIKDVFFKEGVSYSAYIIIKPDGSYVTYFGEFSKTRVFSDLAKLSKK